MKIPTTFSRLILSFCWLAKCLRYMLSVGPQHALFSGWPHGVYHARHVATGGLEEVGECPNFQQPGTIIEPFEGKIIMTVELLYVYLLVGCCSKGVYTGGAGLRDDASRRLHGTLSCIVVHPSSWLVPHKELHNEWHGNYENKSSSSRHLNIPLHESLAIMKLLNLRCITSVVLPTTRIVGMKSVTDALKCSNS